MLINNVYPELFGKNKINYKLATYL